MGSCMRHLPFHAGVGEGLRVSYGRQQWQNTTVEYLLYSLTLSSDRLNGVLPMSVRETQYSMAYSHSSLNESDEWEAMYED